MKKFVHVYFDQPQITTAEEGKKHQALGMDWAKELGDAIVEMGNPAKPGKTVTNTSVVDADGQDRFSGYSVIQAKSLEEAVSYTQNCPFVVDGGTMGVHAMESMGMKTKD